MAKKQEPKELDVAASRLLTTMEDSSINSEQYVDCLSKLERIEKLRLEREPKKFSPDAVIAVVGNLLSVGLIVAYEQKHVFTTKAFTAFVKKSG